MQVGFLGTGTGAFGAADQGSIDIIGPTYYSGNFVSIAEAIDGS
jgi:hypothetical protein